MLAKRFQVMAMVFAMCLYLNNLHTAEGKIGMVGEVGAGRDFNLDSVTYMGWAGAEDSGECCKECSDNRRKDAKPATEVYGNQMYAYNADWGMCSCLKTKYGNKPVTVASETAFSGICEDACFDENIDYPGNDINLNYVRTNLKNTAKACQDMCEETHNCNYFTWSPTNKRCYLKSSKSGASSEEGAISGPKSCNENAMFGSVMNIDNNKYPDLFVASHDSSDDVDKRAVPEEVHSAAHMMAVQFAPDPKCLEFVSCVQCQQFRSGEYMGVPGGWEKCQKCTFKPVGVDLNAIQDFSSRQIARGLNPNVCTFLDDKDNCRFSFAYRLQNTNVPVVWVQKTKTC